MVISWSIPRPNPNPNWISLWLLSISLPKSISIGICIWICISQKFNLEEDKYTSKYQIPANTYSLYLIPALAWWSVASAVSILLSPTGLGFQHRHGPDLSLSTLVAPSGIPSSRCPFIQHPLIHYCTVLVLHFRCINNSTRSFNWLLFTGSQPPFSLLRCCWAFELQILSIQLQFLLNFELPHQLSWTEHPIPDLTWSAKLERIATAISQTCARRQPADMPCGFGGSKTTQRKLVLLYVDHRSTLHLRLSRA